MLLSLCYPKAGLLVPIIFKAGIDDGDGDVDEIAAVDVVGNIVVEMAVDRMEGRDTSRSMGQRGAKRTKGRHMNERSIDI